MSARKIEQDKKKDRGHEGRHGERDEKKAPDRAAHQKIAVEEKRQEKPDDKLNGRAHENEQRRIDERFLKYSAAENEQDRFERRKKRHPALTGP
jgi:hypothetical protein